MENVKATLELTSVLFQCGIITFVGIYVLNCYRNYRSKIGTRKQASKIVLAKTKKGLA